MSEKIRKILLVICTVVFLCCLGALGYYFVGRYIESRTTQRVAELVASSTPAPTTAPTPTPEQTPEITPEPTPTPILEKYAALYEENQETIGWLRIEGTTTDYVVMHTPEDPEKYLHLDFFGANTGRGTLFLDYRDDIQTSDNLIIYGHHMNDGSMFGSLDSYRMQSYWETHPLITFDTIYQEQTFEIVAAFYAYVLPRGEQGFRYYHFIEADSEEEFNEFKDFIEENRCYETGVDYEFGDQLLTLSTCAYHVQNGRFAVVAKRIEPEPDRELFQTPKGSPAPEESAAPEAENPVTEITEEPPALASAPEEENSYQTFSTDLILLALLLISIGIATIGIFQVARKK